MVRTSLSLAIFDTASHSFCESKNKQAQRKCKNANAKHIAHNSYYSNMTDFFNSRTVFCSTFIVTDVTNDESSDKHVNSWLD